MQATVQDHDVGKGRARGTVMFRIAPFAPGSAAEADTSAAMRPTTGGGA